MTVAGNFLLAGSATATGVLNIGGSRAPERRRPACSIRDANLGAGSRLNFNHTDPGYVFATVVSGAGSVNQPRAHEPDARQQLQGATAVKAAHC